MLAKTKKKGKEKADKEYETVEETTYANNELSLREIAQKASERTTLWEVLGLIFWTACGFYIISLILYLFLILPDLLDVGACTLFTIFLVLLLAIFYSEGVGAQFRINPQKVQAFSAFLLVGLILSMYFAYFAQLQTIVTNL